MKTNQIIILFEDSEKRYSNLTANELEVFKQFFDDVMEYGLPIAYSFVGYPDIVEEYQNN
jgi:hypothetical protein